MPGLGPAALHLTVYDLHREQHEQHKRAFWMLRERRAGKVVLSVSSLLKKRVPRTVGGEGACVVTGSLGWGCWCDGFGRLIVVLFHRLGRAWRGGWRSKAAFFVSD